MRRPLADAGLIFILIILIIQLIFPHSYADMSASDGSYYHACGIVVRRETKVKDDTATTIVYVKNNVPQSGASSGGPDNCVPYNMEVMCYMADGSPIPKLGSTVEICGDAHAFSQARNPGNFDQIKYYETMNTALALYSATLENESQACGAQAPYWHLMEKLSSIRNILSSLCDLCFTEQDSGVVKTMLLGDRSTLDADLKSLYSASGIAHILAISGLHISMLGTGFYTLLKKLRCPAPVSAITAMVLMILYGLMAGMAASAARAIIMFSFRMGADLLHRTYDMATAFVMAAVMLLAGQPLYLFYSGFQFSFGAILAVLVVAPIFEDALPSRLAGPVSINAITLPVYLYNYYYFPMLSFILNLLVIPIMSILMVAMLVALAGCAIYVSLGKLLALPVHFILLFYEYLCRLCQQIPDSKMVTGKPAVFQIVIYFIILALIIFFNRRMSNMQLIMALAAAGLILTANLRFGLEMTMIDVGQGDSIYITDHRGMDILIDGGSSTESDVGRYRIAPFLLSQGVYELDAVFITHMDSDHYNGIPWMIENSGISSPIIKRVIFTKSTVLGNDDSYLELRSAAEEKGITVSEVRQGDIFQGKMMSGNNELLRLYCLYPDESCTGQDTNEESLVMLMKYGKTDILLTGDLEGEGEEKVSRLLKSLTYIGSDDIRVLKIAHHGSKNSTTDSFLNRFSPAIGLISAGSDNRYGHPHAETLTRLQNHDVDIFSTIDLGAISLRINSDNISVEGFLD